MSNLELAGPPSADSTSSDEWIGLVLLCLVMHWIMKKPGNSPDEANSFGEDPHPIPPSLHQ
ncbi:hypothetical protein DYD21_00565 [Rhodohalobacter sp. SW132]|nr:hypothetical protein DYD21_00565 [Rhodohalobacter sp. SW132]